jgi:hypothetical protein
MLFGLGYRNQTQALGREFAISGRRFHPKVLRLNRSPDNPTKANSAILRQSQRNPIKSNLTIARCDRIGPALAVHSPAI